jgi:hypothetical protein
MNHKRNITPFNKTGVKLFTDQILADTMNRLDYGAELNDISIKIGSRFITVPMCPEAYENLCEFLKTTLNELEDENNA